MVSPHPPPHPYPYPFPVAPRLPSHPRATTSLVLGIVGLAGFFVLLVPIVACPLAWYYGAVAQRDAEREPDRWRSGGEARTGMILGMIGSALLAVFLLFVLVAAALAVILSRYDAGYGT